MGSHSDRRIERDLEYAAGGIAAVYFISWCFRWWQEILLAFVLLWAANWIHIHVFSSQTTDLGSYIDEQYKKIGVKIVTAEQNHNYSFLADQEWSYKDVEKLTVSVTNNTSARILQPVIRCTGTATRNQPDGYPNQVQSADMTFDLNYGSLEPGETKLYDAISSRGYLRADANTVSCVPHASTSFNNADFYRSKGEMDRWGLASVVAATNITMGSRPSTYLGKDYDISIQGSLKNLGSSPVKSFTLRCESYDGLSQNYSSFRLPVEPFRKVVESDESVVIQGAVGGHRACGQKITVAPQIVEGFGIRAI